MFIFSTRSYQYLRDGLCRVTGFTPGRLDQADFADGEHYDRIVDDVDDRPVALVGGTVSDRDTLELYDLACGLVQQGAATLSMVIPYFGYSTMERVVKDGEVVKAKTRARLLSSVPQAVRGNRIALLDLHSAGLPYYFEGAVHAVHLYAKPIVIEAAKRLGNAGKGNAPGTGGGEYVLACTDAGRAKWVESLANDLHVPASFVFKRRDETGRPQVTAVSAQVQSKRVVIYDDMIRSGSSLMNAARAYRDAGAESIAAITTHGLFPGDAIDKLRGSGLFTQIVTTDSHPRAVQLAADHADFLRVESIAPIVADFLTQKRARP